MTISTYAELTAAISRIANRDDLTDDMLSGYVQAAETDATSKLRVRQMICRASADISEEYAQIPSNFCGVKAMSLTDVSPAQPLRFVDAADIRDQKSASVAAGRPRLYSIVGPEFQFYPTPDTTYTVELVIYEQIPSLETTDPGDHWLFTRYPNAMLYGGLTQFAKEYGDPNLATWEAAYERQLEAIRQADSFEHHSNRPTQRLRRFG